MSETNVTSILAGKSIKDLREEFKITKRELAEQIGAPSVTVVEEIESGARAIPAQFVKGFVRTFGATAQDFTSVFGVDGATGQKLAA